MRKREGSQEGCVFTNLAGAERRHERSREDARLFHVVPLDGGVGSCGFLLGRHIGCYCGLLDFEIGKGLRLWSGEEREWERREGG